MSGGKDTCSISLENLYFETDAPWDIHSMPSDINPRTVASKESGLRGKAGGNCVCERDLLGPLLRAPLPSVHLPPLGSTASKTGTSEEEAAFPPQRVLLNGLPTSTCWVEIHGLNSGSSCTVWGWGLEGNQKGCLGSTPGQPSQSSRNSAD